MIDSDMVCEGQTICRMIRSEKPLIAAAYSKRSMDLEVFSRSGLDTDAALADRAALALEFNISPMTDVGTRRIRVTDGMCRVHYIALGCSVIRRDVFEGLIDSGIVRARPDYFLQRSGFDGPFFNFFDEIVRDDGDILSEDYSFCKRWL